VAALSKGYIYIIDPHMQVGGRSVLKIGLTTRSPHRRLKELQTSIPHRMSLIHAAEFPNVEWAERHLHQSLSNRNVRADGGKEFFFLNQNDAVEIVNVLAYQVSEVEAKRALDRDLNKFIEKISSHLSRRVSGRLALAAFIVIVVLIVANSGNTRGMGEFLFLIVFSVLGPALMGALIFGGIGMGIGDFIAKRKWKNEIALERQRLLEVYPAAKVHK